MNACECNGKHINACIIHVELVVHLQCIDTTVAHAHAVVVLCNACLCTALCVTAFAAHHHVQCI